MRHRWGRSQRHHRRKRSIYALLFPSMRACYIGQSVDVDERVAQHRRPQGGWAGMPFEVVILETAEATEAEAVELEYAWRLVAKRQGLWVYGKPGVIVDPSRRATLGRRWKSWRRQWPGTAPWWHWKGLLLPGALAAVFYLLIPI